VKAILSIFHLTAEELIVPELHQYVGAIGCAVLENGTLLTRSSLAQLNVGYANAAIKTSASLKLDTANVRFESHRQQQIDYADMDPIRAHLGFDIGSVSTNLVLLDEQERVIDEIYTRTEGKPLQVVQREMAHWLDKWGDKVQILSVGSTGSGRDLIGELVGADAVHDEITAHKTGASSIARRLFNEPVDTIFEIGGQDSKFIAIDAGIVVDFSMNEACAAGTGSFLEEQAGKLGISIIDEFAHLALSSDEPIRLGERCTVFMEKDVTTYMQQGREVKDIAAGLAYAIVHNYLNRVVRGRRIGDFIYFQGGTAYNQAVAAAFTKVLGKKIVVPPHNGVIGAIGAALLAKAKLEREKGRTRFRGFDLTKVDFKIRQFMCKGCSNNCDIQECTIDGEKTYWGDKCSHRYQKKTKVAQKATIPNLFTLHEEWLQEDIPGPDGLGIRIGIPKSMYYYDRFPFWRTYFKQIGAQVVLSSDTTTQLAADGRELCIAEPCFPIIIGHGHYVDLLRKNVNYIFMPQIINSETDAPEKESWVCPWGQTLSLVIRNSIDDETRIEQLL
ncbi:CoA activase, partial [candidate division KSB1 bacterium]